MGFLSKFFGGDSGSIPPSSENNGTHAAKGTGTVPAPPPDAPSDLSADALEPAPHSASAAVTSEGAAPGAGAVSSHSGAASVGALPSPSSYPPVKAPVPPFPVAPKPHLPLAPPPRTATLVGIEVPANGRYRLAATSTPVDAVGSREGAPAAKVIINADALDTGEAASKPQERKPATSPKTAVRVGLKSKSLRELEDDSFIEEATNPGVGAHTALRPALAPRLPRTELDFLADFALHLGLGPVSPLWVREAKPAVALLQKAAEQAGSQDLSAALAGLGNALADAPSSRLDGPLRHTLLGCLRTLEPWLKATSDLRSAQAARERLIIDQLLAQLSGVSSTARQRLEDKGYASLERLSAADAMSLAHEAELTHEQAQSLLTAFREYREAHAERMPPCGKSFEPSVSEALRALERSAAEFDETCNQDDAARKRAARRQRQQAIISMNLLLAELGEAELLGELVRCSVHEKLELLRQWLANTGASEQ